jgi:hypothetical protein
MASEADPTAADDLCRRLVERWNDPLALLARVYQILQEREVSDHAQDG